MDQKAMRATIDDVARESKVSKTTVSRFINGKYEYMSLETRNKIQEVIEKLEYRPSTIAQSLKAQKTGVIGCIIADITNPFSSYIVKGVYDVCRENGYRVLFANTDNDRQSEIDSIQSLMDSRMDGMIVNTAGKNEEYLIDINHQGLPIVLADRSMNNKYKLDTVTTENFHSTYHCIQFLKKQGYSKVAFFTQELGENTSRNTRYNAYAKAVADLFGQDGKADSYIIDTTNHSVCIRHLVKLKEENPEGEAVIFTVNGVTLLNVLTAMKEKGYAPGKDFGICGFDDWGWASLIPPGITTITQDSYLTGVKSAQLLLDRIDQKVTGKKRFIELPTQLTVRESTTPYHM